MQYISEDSVLYLSGGYGTAPYNRVQALMPSSYHIGTEPTQSSVYVQITFQKNINNQGNAKLGIGAIRNSFKRHTFHDSERRVIQVKKSLLKNNPNFLPVLKP